MNKYEKIINEIFDAVTEEYQEVLNILFNLKSIDSYEKVKYGKEISRIFEEFKIEYFEKSFKFYNSKSKVEVLNEINNLQIKYFKIFKKYLIEFMKKDIEYLSSENKTLII